MPIQDLLTRWMRNGDLVQSATISLQHNEKSLLAWGRPHKLDQVLGLTARAVEAVVEPFGAAMREAGHHISDIETLHGGLDARGDTPINMPRLRAVARLGVVADRRGVRLGAAHSHIVGDGLDEAAEHVVARKPNTKSMLLASQKSITSGRP